MLMVLAEDSIAFMKKENHHSNTIQNVFYSSPPQVVILHIFITATTIRQIKIIVE